VSRTLPVLRQFPSVHIPERFPAVSVTPTITDLLAAGAPVGIGVSGGKDSAVTAHVLQEYLDSLGHTGPRLLIHSDLGPLIEWRESLPVCQSLAERLGLELVVLHEDLIGRWKKRWQDNTRRYADLRCVKIIMPWSAAGLLRFCTSEQKVSPICRALTGRFPGNTILSASGIRRDESDERRKALVCKEQPRLLRKKLQTTGFDWHPILEWTLNDVLAFHKVRDIPLHAAYLLGCSRVSCVFCVLSSRENLYRATLCEDNHAGYRELVALEILSSFSFQSGYWLGDINPALLDDAIRDGLQEAKRRAARRTAAEARLPQSLLYVKGWPVQMPTLEEARLLGEVRKTVADAIGISIGYTEPGEILDRFTQLLAEKELRQGRAAMSEHDEEGRTSGQQTLWDMPAV
jgi:3'-phosphoadenosine 5'-phosphosulfate sulfotransferase (PAPS reductase)/FAD synthetase